METEENKKSYAHYLHISDHSNLNQVCQMLSKTYGHSLYLVGSCLRKKDWRDVDIRCILADELFDKLFFTEEIEGETISGKCIQKMQQLAISEWLRKMTGLPVDFQFQKRTKANEEYGSAEHPRNAIGLNIRGNIL